MLCRHTAVSIVREGEHKNMACFSIVTLLVAITSSAVYVNADLTVKKQLELLNGNLVKMQEMFKVQVTQLQEKVNRLEALEHKVEQQESLISELQRDSTRDGSFRVADGSSATLRQETSKIPRSCADLKNLGHVSSGLFSVMGAKSVEMVFCDFCKQSTDPGFQTWIGIEEVKSAPTYFMVQLVRNFREQNVPIPFDVEPVNIGRAMNLQTGKFTAPRPGTYFFSFTGWVYFPPVPLKDDFNVFLYLNGNSIARGHVNEMTNNKQVFGELMETFTMQATLSLKAGDQIWLMVAYSSSGLVLCGSNVTHFTGFMLQEDISQSVKF